MAIVPKKQKIDKLERDLYSRDAPDITTKQRPDLSPHEEVVQNSWATERDIAQDAADVSGGTRKISLTNKIFIASAIFFVVAAGIASYVILGGLNVISSKNVDISVQGLAAISAGEEVVLDITIQNNNNTQLSSGTIYVEYPQGTRRADDITKELVRDEIDLGSVSSGESVTKTVKAVFFGGKDSVKEVKISVDYSAQSSNATFSKEKLYDLTIKSSPILMTVDVPKEVNSGQDIVITAEIASNSNTVVRDLLVRADYPFGFTFTGAQPQTTFDTNVWKVGDLAPNEKKTITIKGRMDGQNEEERTFRFAAGTPSSTDEKQVAVSYIDAQQSLFIKKAFIGLDLELNNKEGVYVAMPGERIQGSLVWTNNLPIAVNDVAIQIKLSGQGFDRSQVAVGTGGYFRSVDNTINWDKNSIAALASVDPGESGSVSFAFTVPQSTTQLLSQGKSLAAVVDATVKGTRIQGGVPQEIRSIVSNQAKVATILNFNGRVLYSTGAFKNNGPVPPKADQETTYTVAMNLSNAFNDATGITVSTQLPAYVSWLGKTSPTSEQISYNESTRTVTWSIPDIRAGAGYTSTAKEASFQVSFLPSVNQIGSTPDLTGTFNVQGTDKYTGSSLTTSRPGLNIRISTDPAFKNGDERVIR